MSIRFASVLFICAVAAVTMATAPQEPVAPNVTDTAPALRVADTTAQKDLKSCYSACATEFNTCIGPYIGKDFGISPAEQVCFDANTACRSRCAQRYPASVGFIDGPSGQTR
jgi:hypothetical protein